MNREGRPSLQEEAVLLMLDDTSGRFLTNAGLVLAGVALGQLAWRGSISLEDGKIVLKDSSPTGDVLLDEMLGALAADPHPVNMVRWLTGVMAYQRVTKSPVLFKAALQRTAAGLVEKGILQHLEGRVFWAFPFIGYPAADTVPEAEIDADLRRAILEGALATEPDALLISLLAVTGGLRQVLTRQEARQSKARLGELRAQTPVIQAISTAVERIVAEQMAAMVAVVVAAGVASS